MRLRPAGAGDAEAIARVHVTSRAAAYGTDPGHADDPAVYRTKWADILARASDVRHWLAEADGGPIGFASAGAARDDDLAGAGSGELFALYVIPAWWGRGAGPALYATAAAHLRDGHAGFVVWTRASNARGRRFYERCGLQLDRVEGDQVRYRG